MAAIDGERSHDRSCTCTGSEHMMMGHLLSLFLDRCRLNAFHVLRGGGSRVVQAGQRASPVHYIRRRTSTCPISC